MKVLRIIGLVAVLLALTVFIYAKLNHVNPLGMVDKSTYNSYSGIAIKGYDPVSYFMEVPTKGTETFTTEWKGVQWNFASLDNKELFLSNPEKYAPQFGGYCSFAVTTGFSATIDPAAYLIKDEKLYFFNGEDLRINFMIDTEKSINTAHSKWNEK
ncbi:MAG: YHS domain protein [Reichenbachiella sp.]